MTSPSKLTPTFGRRKARKLKPISQKAYEDVLPHLRLNPEGPFFDYPFKEIWLEIGFGGGEHLISQLETHPDVAIIGCEPFMNGVAKLIAHLPPENYGRVRIWQDDVRLLLEVLPKDFFSRVFILFPDPWPKKRHHKRRLITKEFLEALLPHVKTGARLHVASDDAPYIEQIQEVLYPFPKLKRLMGPPSADPKTWEPRPEDWPSTRYEQKALRQGKPCAYMAFEKIG